MKLSLTIFSLCLAANNVALACSPKIRHVSDYAEGAIFDHAVFVGEVKSVSIQPSTWGTNQEIKIEVIEWLSGEQRRPIVTVRGATSTYRGTNCSGKFDFSANVGEKWLIFGQNHEGAVNPDSFLSRLAPGGRVALDLIDELKRAPAPVPSAK